MEHMFAERRLLSFGAEAPEIRPELQSGDTESKGDRAYADAHRELFIRNLRQTVRDVQRLRETNLTQGNRREADRLAQVIELLQQRIAREEALHKERTETLLAQARNTIRNAAQPTPAADVPREGEVIVETALPETPADAPAPLVSAVPEAERRALTVATFNETVSVAQIQVPENGPVTITTRNERTFDPAIAGQTNDFIASRVRAVTGHRDLSMTFAQDGSATFVFDTLTSEQVRQLQGELLRPDERTPEQAETIVLDTFATLLRNTDIRLPEIPAGSGNAMRREQILQVLGTIPSPLDIGLDAEGNLINMMQNVLIPNWANIFRANPAVALARLMVFKMSDGNQYVTGLQGRIRTSLTGLGLMNEVQYPDDDESINRVLASRSAELAVAGQYFQVRQWLERLVQIYSIPEQGLTSEELRMIARIDDFVYIFPDLDPRRAINQRNRENQRVLRQAHEALRRLEREWKPTDSPSVQLELLRAIQESCPPPNYAESRARLEQCQKTLRNLETGLRVTDQAMQAISSVVPYGGVTYATLRSGIGYTQGERVNDGTGGQRDMDLTDVGLDVMLSLVPGARHAPGSHAALRQGLTRMNGRGLGRYMRFVVAEGRRQVVQAAIEEGKDCAKNAARTVIRQLFVEGRSLEEIMKTLAASEDADVCRFFEQMMIRVLSNAAVGEAAETGIRAVGAGVARGVGTATRRWIIPTVANMSEKGKEKLNTLVQRELNTLYRDLFGAQADSVPNPPTTESFLSPTS